VLSVPSSILSVGSSGFMLRCSCYVGGRVPVFDYIVLGHLVTAVYAVYDIRVTQPHGQFTQEGKRVVRDDRIR